MPAKSSGTPQRPAGVRASTRSCRPAMSRRAALRQRGVDPARQHRVDLDVVLGPGAGERARQLHDAALGRGIGCGERRAEDRHHRADVDDLAAARRDHRRIGRLAADEGAGEVGLEDHVPLLERVLLRLLADVGAGVVDQDVEPAELLDALLHQRLAGVRAGDVDRDRERLGAEALELADRGLALVLVAAGDHHGRAGRREAARHAEPDAAIAAGDDRDPARQIEQFHPVAPSLAMPGSLLAGSGARRYSGGSTSPGRVPHPAAPKRHGRRGRAGRDGRADRRAHRGRPDPRSRCRAGRRLGRRPCRARGGDRGARGALRREPGPARPHADQRGLARRLARDRLQPPGRARPRAPRDQRGLQQLPEDRGARAGRPDRGLDPAAGHALAADARHGGRPARPASPRPGFTPSSTRATAAAGRAPAPRTTWSSSPRSAARSTCSTRRCRSTSR